MPTRRIVPRPERGANLIKFSDGERQLDDIPQWQRRYLDIDTQVLFMQHNIDGEEVPGPRRETMTYEEWVHRVVDGEVVNDVFRNSVDAMTAMHFRV